MFLSDVKINKPGIICFIVLIHTVFSDNLTKFPLWGSTWIVAQGLNKKVFPSVLPFAPQKVAMIEFDSEMDSVRIRYANCMTHKEYKGTYDILKEVKTQFDRNIRSVHFTEINNKTGILNIQYQPYNDSVFTLHKKMIPLLEQYEAHGCFIRQGSRETTYMGIDGLNKLRKELEENNCYTIEKPTGYYIRKAIDSDYATFKYGMEMEIAGKKTTVYLKVKEGTNQVKYYENAPVQNYLVKETGNVHIYIWDLDFKTDNIGYWQIHIHPEIWYFPRDIETGEPIVDTGVMMTYAEAREKKIQSLKDKDNIELQYYRDPYMSDSASVVISFSFVAGGINMHKRDYISLSSTEINSKMDFEHIPSRMYKVQKNTKYDMSLALLQLYTESREEEMLAKTINERCSNWEFIDEMNGTIIFKEIDVLAKLEKNSAINDAIFMYNDCPCRQLKEFGGLTKAQLKKYIYKPVPSCRLSDLEKTYVLYVTLLDYLDKPSDQALLNKKIKTIKRLLKKKRAFYKEHPDLVAKKHLVEKYCPNSWINAKCFDELGIY